MLLVLAVLAQVAPQVTPDGLDLSKLPPWLAAVIAGITALAALAQAISSMRKATTAEDRLEKVGAALMVTARGIDNVARELNRPCVKCGHVEEVETPDGAKVDRGTAAKLGIKTEATAAGVEPVLHEHVIAARGGP